MSRFRVSQLISRIALGVLVLTLLIPFGTPTVEAANGGSIEGTVTDNQTGLPVSGALVQLADLGLETTSSTEGQFSWQGVSLAQDVLATTVTVNASGYGEWRLEDVRVVAGDTLVLDVSLGIEPTVIKVPPPGSARPTSDQAMQPESAVDLTATDQTDAPLPATIDVRVTGYAYCDTSRPYTVETVDFKEYVKHVLPNEWIPGEIEEYGMPRESLRAGAMAVKLYAWSYIAAGGKWNDADVYDSTCDQVYIPSVSYTSTNNAVDFTWNWRLTRQSDGSLVRAFYRAHYSQCEEADLADRCMGQYDSAALAYNRLTWDEILASFYVGSQINDIWSPPGGYSLRFEGNGYGDLDRVKIQLDGPARPVNVGSTDFTLEFWMKATPGENDSVACSNADGAWINGNTVFDRDVYGAGDHGDFAVSLMNGRIAFGVNNGTSGSTVCGTVNVADGGWHHIAVQRAINTGLLQIWVDGVLDSETSGPTGDISYRDGRTVHSSYPNEPFLVIGAEKHDLDNNLYPS
ncbi:MAG: carboxypeptidase regulatory-like domain-containing protein, partial [Anaerolineales bacterium]